MKFFWISCDNRYLRWRVEGKAKLDAMELANDPVTQYTEWRARKDAAKQQAQAAALALEGAAAAAAGDSDGEASGPETDAAAEGGALVTASEPAVDPAAAALAYENLMHQDDRPPTELAALPYQPTF